MCGMCSRQTRLAAGKHYAVNRRAAATRATVPVGRVPGGKTVYASLRSHGPGAACNPWQRNASRLTMAAWLASFWRKIVPAPALHIINAALSSLHSLRTTTHYLTSSQPPPATAHKTPLRAPPPYVTARTHASRSAQRCSKSAHETRTCTRTHCRTCLHSLRLSLFAHRCTHTRVHGRKISCSLLERVTINKLYSRTIALSKQTYLAACARAAASRAPGIAPASHVPPSFCCRAGRRADWARKAALRARSTA